jgi:hypothetical protein
MTVKFPPRLYFREIKISAAVCKTPGARIIKRVGLKWGKNVCFCWILQVNHALCAKSH